MPGASHRPPTSPSTSTRRPCRPSRRSFPSCPSVVPAPPGTGGKLCPPAPRLLDARWGTGPVGRAGGAPPVVGGGAEAEAPVPLAGSTGNRACRQRAAAGEWEESERAGRREETGGGSRRRRWRRGGRADRGWVEGAPGGRTHRPQHPRSPGPPPWRSYTPFPPGLRATGGQRSVRGLPDSGRDPGRSGRVGAHGELGRGGGGTPPSDPVRAPEFRTVGSD